MSDFVMPSLGADMEAGTLVEWLKKPGESVKPGDVVAVVETQKGAIEIEIFEAGIIDQLLVQPGQEVPVGTPLARLCPNGAAQEPEPLPPQPPPEVPPEPERLPPEPPPEMPPPEVPPEVTPPPEQPPVEIPEPEAKGGLRARVSPAARQRAVGLGLDLAGVRGMGPMAPSLWPILTPRPASATAPRPRVGHLAPVSIRPRCARRLPPPWRVPSARSRTTT